MNTPDCTQAQIQQAFDFYRKRLVAYYGREVVDGF